METTRRRARVRGWHLFAAVAVAAVAVPIGIAGATHDSNAIHACVRGTDGLVRIVSSDADCRTGESAVQWNRQGPTGPAGPAGPAGPPGPAGSGGGGSALPPPEVSYLTCTGGQQGVIKGDSTQESHADWMEVISYSHEVTSPVDAGSGQATGKRQHKPLVITKELDQASPRLMQALVSGEALQSCKLELVQPTGDGLFTRFRIELQNARIVGVQQGKAIPHADTPTAPLETEEVSFTYQKIIWTWVDGGVTSEDTWSQQI